MEDFDGLDFVDPERYEEPSEDREEEEEEEEDEGEGVTEESFDATREDILIVEDCL